MLENLSPELEIALERDGTIVKLLEGIYGAKSGSSASDASNFILEKDSSVSVIPPKGVKIIANKISDVIVVLQEVLNRGIAVTSPNWAKGKQITITHHSPAQEQTTPGISIRIVDGQPGAAGSGPQGSPSRRMVEPILVGTFIGTSDFTAETFIFSQRFDYVIEINVVAKTSNEADEIKEWMNNLIYLFKWYVKHSGFSDFTFLRELGEEIESTYYKRTVQYAVSFNKLKWINHPRLKEIIFNLQKQDKI